MQQIDIQTTQNVKIEYELAGLKDRFVAMLIDSIIIFIICITIIFISFWALGGILEESSMSMYALLGLFPLLAFMGYHLLFEIIGNGQSLGKKMMGLKVVRLDGEELGLSDVLLRTVFHIIDTVLSMGIMAALLIASSQRKQRLGDMTANTTIIKLKSKGRFELKDIIKINTIQEYQPIYQEVKHFKESDMLLIKSIIARYKKYPNQAHKEALHQAVLRCSKLLQLEVTPKKQIEFLETLVKDYVVLTR